MPFTTELQVKKIPKEDAWELISPLVYVYQEQEHISEVYSIPRGFVTDFASVPRIPFVYSATGNTGHKAAALHDYLYSIGESRSRADAIFHAALLETEPKWRAWVMYTAVRLFGWMSYGY